MVPAINRSVVRALVAALLSVVGAAPLMAKEEPVLEVGLGLGAIAFEDTVNSISEGTEFDQVPTEDGTGSSTLPAR